MEGDDKLILGLTRQAVEHLVELDGGECINDSVVEMGGERQGCEECAEIRREAKGALKDAEEAEKKNGD